jgi:3-oxoacyl-[acyl-carrier-protein] synthase III
MATTTIVGPTIVGIASAVPEREVPVNELASLFGAEEIEKISRSVGVQSRHIAGKSICTSDLCFAAAEGLIARLGWERDSIDGIIFVSQFPDYQLPATSCTLQARLRLPKTCAAFDINLGCSGYTYGLWTASSLMAAGGLRRVLLLAGDISSRNLSPLDRSTVVLFGDAGTATALQFDPTAQPLFFTLGTDGTGYQHIIIPGGGHRLGWEDASPEMVPRTDGIPRNDFHLSMNGEEVFAFTLREVPPMIRTVLAEASWTIETPDAFVFHQANRFLLEHLSKKLKIPTEKLAIGMTHFGNTSSASIPLTLTTTLRDRLTTEPTRLVLAGFGVGLSWGAVAVQTNPMLIPELVLVSDDGTYS